MTIEKNINGAYVVSDIVNGYRVRLIVYGSKRYAVKAFRNYIKQEETK